MAYAVRLRLSALWRSPSWRIHGQVSSSQLSCGRRAHRSWATYKRSWSTPAWHVEIGFYTARSFRNLITIVPNPQIQTVAACSRTVRTAGIIQFSSSNDTDDMPNLPEIRNRSPVVFWFSVPWGPLTRACDAYHCKVPSVCPMSLIRRERGLSKLQRALRRQEDKIPPRRERC